MSVHTIQGFLKILKSNRDSHDFRISYIFIPFMLYVRLSSCCITTFFNKQIGYNIFSDNKTNNPYKKSVQQTNKFWTNELYLTSIFFLFVLTLLISTFSYPLSLSLSVPLFLLCLSHPFFFLSFAIEQLTLHHVWITNYHFY